MGPTHFYAARAEKPPKKADFAMKQTNICRLSSDIKKTIQEMDELYWRSENRSLESEDTKNGTWVIPQKIENSRVLNIPEI